MKRLTYLAVMTLFALVFVLALTGCSAQRYPYCDNATPAEYEFACTGVDDDVYDSLTTRK